MIRERTSDYSVESYELSKILGVVQAQIFDSP